MARQQSAKGDGLVSYYPPTYIITIKAWVACDGTGPCTTPTSLKEAMTQAVVAREHKRDVYVSSLWGGEGEGDNTYDYIEKRRLVPPPPPRAFLDSMSKRVI